MIINALFELSTFIALIFAYYLGFSNETDEAVGLRKIFSIVSVFILFFMLILVCKYFAVDPIDKAILINEQAIVYYVN
jgi:hypothetical protein